MEFLNPAALYAVLFLPLLLIPYLMKRQPKRFVFSSLLLLRELPSHSAGRPWGRLRLPPIFFLQLLLLLLLILALGEPVFSLRPHRIAIVLDNSASMQALEGGKSRFEIALDEARRLLRNSPERTKIDLYSTVPRLERVGPEDMAASAASALVSGLLPYDLGEPPGDLMEELSRLAKERGLDRIYFLTDHPARGRGGVIRVVSVGRPRENLALTSFNLFHPSPGSSQLEARAEITSFSSKEEKAKVVLKGGGRITSTRSVTVPPGKLVAVSFEEVPALPVYEAELEVGDGFALDNRRFATLPPAKELKVLGISPRPEALYSLRSIPGLSFRVVSPGDYEKTEAEGHALEIFHFSAPAVLPQKHALLVLPPKENPLVAVGTALSRPQISSWRDPHSLTRYINFALFRPVYGRTIKPLSFGDAIIQSPEGALAIVTEHGGFRYLVLGFDPFPYLGRENLPISIFTLNLLDWFYDGARSPETATGEPLPSPRRYQSGIVVTPKGEQISIRGGQPPFSRTFFQGIYQFTRGSEKEFIAVNFQDQRESDLNNPPPIDLREEAGVSTSPSFLFSLWPYILMISIVLLLLEWVWNPPSRPSASRLGGTWEQLTS